MHTSRFPRFQVYIWLFVCEVSSQIDLSLTYQGFHKVERGSCSLNIVSSLCKLCQFVKLTLSGGIELHDLLKWILSIIIKGIDFVVCALDWIDIWGRLLDEVELSPRLYMCCSWWCVHFQMEQANHIKLDSLLQRKVDGADDFDCSDWLCDRELSPTQRFKFKVQIEWVNFAIRVIVVCARPDQRLP